MTYVVSQLCAILTPLSVSNEGIAGLEGQKVMGASNIELISKGSANDLVMDGGLSGSNES